MNEASDFDKVYNSYKYATKALAEKYRRDKLLEEDFKKAYRALEKAHVPGPYRAIQAP